MHVQETMQNKLFSCHNSHFATRIHKLRNGMAVLRYDGMVWHGMVWYVWIYGVCIRLQTNEKTGVRMQLENKKKEK